MSQQTGADKPELNALGKLAVRVAEYGQNATNNISNSFSSLTTQGWIRLIVIVGGYMLLRPHLMKFVTKGAVKKMEEDDARSREKDAAEAEITPNEFRGIKEKLMVQAEEDEGDGTGADWGQKARVRQRQMLKDLLEEEERRRAAENEDADIQEFLED
ncbi:hypothetical protein JDV02_005208 [Purpureocillium takamizusanense]|uniref:Uncharacterized protein n=1 Tax=Purpureocillium takamizusanense TaxID=2060973 RepID=A0A9Q8QHY6_9HYPO|nr:uncharacterized protein JDV02_005208 [Purpureocillium takamizusanense]UNI18982.1 hypothetical protein JDV02_005208 [Purpureocillium takamizusanense]